MGENRLQIDSVTIQILQELAEKAGLTPGEILSKALEDYRKKMFLETVNAGYSSLKADSQAWADELAERTAWDSTLEDGVEPNEWPDPE